jgi:hypothetical protein
LGRVSAGAVASWCKRTLCWQLLIAGEGEKFRQPTLLRPPTVTLSSRGSLAFRNSQGYDNTSSREHIRKQDWENESLWIRMGKFWCQSKQHSYIESENIAQLKQWWKWKHAVRVKMPTGAISWHCLEAVWSP